MDEATTAAEAAGSNLQWVGDTIGVSIGVVIGWALSFFGTILARKADRSDRLDKAYADWGALVLKTGRTKRAHERALVELEGYSRLGREYPRENLDRLLTEIESVRHSMDISLFTLLQLDPEAIRDVNQVTHLLHENKTEEAEKAAVTLVVRRARKRKRMAPILHPASETQESQSAGA